jgi:hypothetical protein
VPVVTPSDVIDLPVIGDRSAERLEQAHPHVRRVTVSDLLIPIPDRHAPAEDLSVLVETPALTTLGRDESYPTELDCWLVAGERPLQRRRTSRLTCSNWPAAYTLRQVGWSP